MKEVIDMTEMLLQTFSAEYLQPLYYFCLRKTGSAEEAEELAADVSLQVVTQLRRGTIPAQFSAWVWQIARNRYSRWVDARTKSRERIVGEPDESLTDDAGTPEEAVIAGEELQLLRRELAFIGREYRELIVAYYFNHETLRAIAARHGMPEGTAKTRLFQARKYLLEGMNMSREFGKRSYNPEKVNFVSCGSQPSGLPWRAVGRALPNNILLEASNNPSTLEDLAIELGVALPYMEEEVALLEKATLLKKIDDKYVTNFYIIDRETQAEVRVMQQSGSTARAKLMAEILSDSEEKLLDLELYDPDSRVSPEAQRWTWAVYLLDRLLEKNAKTNHVGECTKRPDGGNWDFCGFEKTTLPNMGSGHNGAGNGKNMLWAYSIPQFDLNESGIRVPQSYHQAVLLAELAREPSAIDVLPETDQELIANCPYVHRDTMDKSTIVIDIAIIDNAADKALEAILDSHPAAAELERLMNETFTAASKLIAAKNNPHLVNQLPRAVDFLHYHLRAMTMIGLVDLGYLAPPADPKTDLSMIYLRLK